jgi:hypothetical protein
MTDRRSWLFGVVLGLGAVACTPSTTTGPDASGAASAATLPQAPGAEPVADSSAEPPPAPKLVVSAPSSSNSQPRSATPQPVRAPANNPSTAKGSGGSFCHEREYRACVEAAERECKTPHTVKKHQDCIMACRAKSPTDARPQQSNADLLDCTRSCDYEASDALEECRQSLPYSRCSELRSRMRSCWSERLELQ